MTPLQHQPNYQGLSLPDFPPFPQLKSVLYGQQFVITEDATAKVMREKWFPGIFAKASQSLTKVCHCLRELP